MIVRCAPVSLALFTVASHAVAQGASWSFDASAEGWVIHDCNCGSNYGPVLATYPLVWQASAGDPGGHVSYEDATNNCNFFAAPAASLGDLSSLIGGELRFSLRADTTDYTGSDEVILIGANGTILVAPLLSLPSVSQWSRYTIALDPSRFRVNSANGATPTPAAFAAVMANVQTLRIPAEFGAIVIETTRLDSVSLVAPCPGDTNGDGVVNFTDLNAVLSAFGQSGAGLPADLNGDGVVNFADLNQVLSAFGTDCD
jgi:hypothetical protein